ncbi:MAG: ATP-binding protein [Burkholderiaceae bacterium]
MMIHVFPEGRMCSLRRALMLWLLPVFVLVAAASAGIAHWSYTRMVSTFMDDQMALLGDSVAGQEQTMALSQLSQERVQKWGTFVVQVYDGKGQLVSTSLPGTNVGVQEVPGFHDVKQGGASWRVYSAAAGDGAAPRRVQVMQSGEFRRHLAAERAGAAIAPVIVLLPLSMLILWGVVAAVSHAISDIARQAAGQDEHSIKELTLANVPEEISPMVASFNSLLRRLRDAFANQRRFVQDAAHELRTPIAAIGLQLENLRGDLAGGETAQRFAQLEAGVQRAQRLVDQLLKLSRQEAARSEPAASAVDLQEMLRESINGLIVIADQKSIDLGLEAQGAAVGKASLNCAPQDLRSVLDNLIENALRYTPQGGVVDVNLREEGGRAVVEVVDTGPGIPPELIGRVFDRFFRVPGTDVRGSGLGLSIARSAAQRCGLKVSLKNREDRSGLIARVELA